MQIEGPDLMKLFMKLEGCKLTYHVFSVQVLRKLSLVTDMPFGISNRGCGWHKTAGCLCILEPSILTGLVPNNDITISMDSSAQARVDKSVCL